MKSRTSFPISKVNALRKRATQAGKFDDKLLQNAWFKSIADPMNLLAVFKTLQLQPNYVLRAYQFHSGGNGNGIIWAMPVDAPFPEPVDCPRLENRFLDPPQPPEALPDFMAAIEGDGSPWSYLSASLFAREAQEFGAMWHGCYWSVHTILGQNPIFELDDSRWTWEQPQPACWEPTLEQTGSEFRLTFLSHTGLGLEAIYRHTDVFCNDNMQFQTTSERLAQGGSGIVF